MLDEDPDAEVASDDRARSPVADGERDRERQTRFLHKLRDELDLEGDPDALLARAAGAVAEHFAVKVASFQEIDLAADRIKVHGVSPGCVPPPGEHALSETFAARTLGALAAGRIVTVDDVRAHPFVADRAGRFLSAGVAACAAIPLMSGERLVGALMLTHDAPRDWSEDLEVARAAGERVWLSHRASRLLADLRAREADLVALRDDLERRVQDRTASLVRANERLRTEMDKRVAAQAALAQSQRLEALGHLSAGIAHDFNNSIAAIAAGFTLVRRWSDDPRVADVVDHGRAAARRSADLVKRLLAFAREGSLRTSIVDLGAAVAEAAPLVGRSLGPSIEFEVAIEAGVHADVDRVSLETCLINLAVNARDAMPDGGRLRIAVSASEPSAPGHPAELAATKAALIAVGDTGAGMSPEVLQRVFEPFFTTKEAGAGTGLGLAMVHGFARQSHGALRIESRPGEGTTVRLFLPAVDPPAVRAAGSDAPTDDDEASPGPATPLDVLLIDDDDPVRALIAAQLRDLGHGVDEAESAARARTLMARRAHDVVLCDVVMPGESGVAFAHALRTEGRRPPLVFMTGHAERGRLSGEIVLDKPFEIAELTAALTTAVRRGRETSARLALVERIGRRIRDPRLAACLDGWRAAAEASPDGRPIVGRAPPDWVDPELALVLDVGASHLPMRFVVLHAGPGPTRAWGRPLEGFEPPVIGSDEPGVQEAAYRRCATRVEPTYDRLRLSTGDGGRLSFERLLVPCSSDGRRVDRIVAAVVLTDVAPDPDRHDAERPRP